MHESVAIGAGRFLTRYVRPSVRTREPRLGLHRSGISRPVSGHPTKPVLDPLQRLRERPSFVAARPVTVRHSPLRHAVRVAWTGWRTELRRPIVRSRVTPWRD